MRLHSVFIFVTNLFGLNFYEEVAPYTLVLLINISVDILTIVTIYFSEVKTNPHFKPIFACVDLVQLVLPLVVKDYMIIHAMFKAEVDKSLERNIRDTFAPVITKKRQKNYLIALAVFVVVYSFKVLDSNVYNWSQYFPNIFNAATDFFYVYQILRVRDHFRDLRTRTGDNLMAEISKAIEVQRAIFSRYSTYLAIAISLYFILTIISLYWIFLRIIYNNFNSIRGEFYEMSPSSQSFQFIFRLYIVLLPSPANDFFAGYFHVTKEFDGRGTRQLCN